MKNLILLGIALTLSFNAYSNVECHSLMSGFLKEANKNIVLQNAWSSADKELFLETAKSMQFTDDEIKVMVDSLNMQKESSSLSTVKSYLVYIKTLKEKEQKNALLDMAQLDSREVHSKHVLKFESHEEKIAKKLSKKEISPEAEARYRELYYGCRSLSPNEVNKNAARDFKRFNLTLGLGTLGASYAYYNMDKEINAEWFEKLAYDVSITVLFSYFSSKIQTKPTDTQLAKSIKNYFMGRVLGSADLFIYGPVFNNERDSAEKRIEELKKDPKKKEKIEQLLKDYEERGLFRKFKDNLITEMKKLPQGIGLGVKGKSIDENNIDWNNLSESDLERPEVQDILVAAAMAQIYTEKKGEWLVTGDSGLDRYAFNSAFYAVTIPKNIAQSLVTHNLLCMGQDTPKLAFAKAVLFNVTASFLTNQVLYKVRETGINQR